MGSYTFPVPRRGSMVVMESFAEYKAWLRRLDDGSLSMAIQTTGTIPALSVPRPKGKPKGKGKR